MTAIAVDRWLCAGPVSEVQKEGSKVVHLDGNTIALFAHEGQIYAVDNRCPHLGFPLHRGTVKDCVLTCHWHQARFDLKSGGTFDQWADDVRSFPTEVRGQEVWVDMAPRKDAVVQQRERLEVGLERNISLVLGKAVVLLLDRGVDPVEPFRTGMNFGVTYRQAGWGQGLTMLSCFMNILPHLSTADRSRALFHGLSAVSRDCAGTPPRFGIRPLPGSGADLPTLKRWFRQFIEVRDSEGGERCVVSAIRTGANDVQMADMLFSAVTDHRYINVGHPLDFTNKALEALDQAGWEYAEPVLTSLVSGYANAERMEESNSWRNPIDLIMHLEVAFSMLPEVLQIGEAKRGKWRGRDTLLKALIGEEPSKIVEGLLTALSEGASPGELAGSVAYTAALRIARFHTSNEFGDWDRAMHTFTFANAVHQGLRRVSSVELLRGVFDAAMSSYLDRFLNVPIARLLPSSLSGTEALDGLTTLLDRQQQVNEAGGLVASYLEKGGDPDLLLTHIGHMLLREDRDFHSIQMIEAAFQQFILLRGTPEGNQVLVAATRYLAAHAPTMRTQGQTYQISVRLYRGERLFEE